MNYIPNYKVDNAFKFGCGRFRQEEHLLDHCADEIKRVGTHPLLVCTDTSAAIAADTIRNSLAAAGIPLQTFIYNGTCTPDIACDVFSRGTLDSCDVLLGCGGGVIIDFTKLLADISHLPVITIPTSSATCCAYTPLSVCYDRSGKSIGSAKYGWSIAAALLDMTILSRQPPRLLVAGACDAMAKKIEIDQRIIGVDDADTPAGFACCNELAKYIFLQLEAKLPQAYQDLCDQKPTKVLYDVVYYAIVGAGLISGLANGSRQSAIAHKFYLFIRTKFTQEAAGFLHGELVAIGLIAQLAFNGNTTEANHFAQRLHDWHLPASMTELHLDNSQAVFDECVAFIVNSSAMANCRPDDIPKLADALKLIF